MLYSIKLDRNPQFFMCTSLVRFLNLLSFIKVVKRKSILDTNKKKEITVAANLLIS